MMESARPTGRYDGTMKCLISPEKKEADRTSTEGRLGSTLINHHRRLLDYILKSPPWPTETHLKDAGKVK